MDYMLKLFSLTASQVLYTLSINWPFLIASVAVAALLKLYVDQDRLAAFMQRNRRSGVAVSTLVGVSTPLCSCGTTAIVLGMMAGSLPWAPIVAFMVASPLSSPQEFVFSAGLFGWRFAITFFVASILLGLMGGAVTQFLETRGWLKNQARMRTVPARVRASDADSATGRSRPTPRDFLKEAWVVGRRLALFFLSFAFIGYFINNLIPATWIPALFGNGKIYGVALAAALGIPFYFNTEASLPLAKTLMESGMSQGAVLAFLITGAGTSIGAIMGALTIARWRIVGLVIATLFAGAVLIGYVYNGILSAGLL
jgi:uncharacterized membrane protein YraQ (UPF0718 family)